MRIETSASVYINAPQDKVWEYVSDLTNVPIFLKGWGPIPGAEKVEVTSGHKKMGIGLTQTTTLTTGQKLFETVKKVSEGEYFEYELVGFKFPISLLTKKAGGSWELREENAGTKTTWTYYFYLTSPLVYPIATLFVKVFYHKALQDAVRRVKKILESQK